MSTRAATAASRSPFAAAFLSFLFPGLGQAFARRYARALVLAAIPVLLVALVAGVLGNDTMRNRLLLNLTSPTILLILLVLNVVVLAYRMFVVVDAYRTAAATSWGTRNERGRTASPAALSLLGLLAILAVMGLGHLAIARYNLLAYDLFSSISQPDASSGAVASSPVGTPAPQGGGTPATPAPPPQYNGGRLTVLLIGSDTRPSIQGRNTDTLITVSIDPGSKQVAMFSLPRDTLNVPLPSSWPASRVWGGVYPQKINSLYQRAVGSPTLFPGDARSRGYNALKGALSELYQIPGGIQYYVEVDFTGFKRVIDTLGGVTIDVQSPVTDDHYPTEDDRSHLNLYIPTGIQRMSGTEALAYARARNKTNDFDRAERQQRVLLSLRRSADPSRLLSPGRLEALVGALKSAIHTDIPADRFPAFASLGMEADLADVRSLVFTPPLFQTECLSCYSLNPKLAAIRRAVKEALEDTPSEDALRLAVAREGAQVTVMNGSGKSGQAAGIAEFLGYYGMNAQVASANRGLADRTDYENTVITVYNGAESRVPQTLQFLEQKFGVKPTLKTDPDVTADIILVTGAKTPAAKAPD